VSRWRQQRTPPGSSPGSSSRSASQAAPRDLGVGLDVYGISRHAQREEAKRLGVEHEVNPGIGVQLRLRGSIVEPLAGVGVYRDSGAKIARYAGPGFS
jgi:hypothetical protein